MRVPSRHITLAQNGTYLRNGPGVWEVGDDGSALDHLFDGYATLVRVSFRRGRAAGDGEAVFAERTAGLLRLVGPGLVRWEGNENGAARSVGREPAMLAGCSSLCCGLFVLALALLLCRLQEHVLPTGAPRESVGRRLDLCRCPDPGSGSRLVNAACFLVPDDDARGNTVTHDLSWFRPRGRTSSKGGVRGHCIILHPEAL